MVVLSVSICNKQGKIFLARQYVPMPRLRIESLLTAFPTLIDSDARKSRNQYTFIESDNIRYLYQPIDDIYLLLLTNLQSNILEDIDTLKMIKTTTPKFFGGFTKDNLISNKIIDLVPVIDEIISPMGYKQKITDEQIKEFVEMDSYSEKVFEKKQNEMIKQQIEFRKLKAIELERLRKQTAKFAPKHNTSPKYTPQTINYAQIRPKTNARDTPKKPHKGKAMQLRKKNEFETEVTKAYEMWDENIGFCDEKKEETFVVNKAVEVNILEKLCVTFDRDGEMKKFQIRGELEVMVTDIDARQCMIQTNVTPKTTFHFGKCLWKLHPKMDSTQWKKGMLCFKDKTKEYRVGSSSKISVLKWNLTVKDESAPITVSFWPEMESENSISISAQYKANAAMKNVIITFPTSSNGDADIREIENGKFELDRNNNEYRWSLMDLQKGDEGTVEYMVKETDFENLYPISVRFEMENSYSNIGITNISDAEEDKVFECTANVSCVSQNYVIE